MGGGDEPPVGRHGHRGARLQDVAVVRQAIQQRQQPVAGLCAPQLGHQVVLQYSHWLNGSLTTVRAGYPPREDVTVIPDEDMVSLSASMWW